MGRTRYVCATIALLLLFGGTPEAQQQQVIPHELGIKYTRDSEEYAALARQVYRTAADALARLTPALDGRPWAVVLDVDETALDNSIYQLERATYGLPFDQVSWSAWIRRRQAPAVPGAVDFIANVRKAGGHIAWITNRLTPNREDTRVNLLAVGLWGDDDRLCAQGELQPTKKSRRAEVAAGTGDCAWAGVPMPILEFIGDQMSDFPDADEQTIGASSDADFGRTFFLLPNPMYGAWTTRVTRTAPADNASTATTCDSSVNLPHRSPTNLFDSEPDKCRDGSSTAPALAPIAKSFRIPLIPRFGMSVAHRWLSPRISVHATDRIRVRRSSVPAHAGDSMIRMPVANRYSSGAVPDIQGDRHWSRWLLESRERPALWPPPYSAARLP